MKEENAQWHLTEENEKKASTDEVKFIFEQAEKQLKESIESGNDAITRTVILLTIIVGFITSLIGFSIDNWEESKQLASPKLITSIAVFFLLFIQVIKLRKNLDGDEYATLGSQPFKLLHNWYFNNYSDETNRTKAIYISEIKSYQRRIIKDNSINEIRWQRFSKCLRFIIWLPLYIAVIYSIVSLLGFIF